MKTKAKHRAALARDASSGCGLTRHAEQAKDDASPRFGEQRSAEKCLPGHAQTYGSASEDGHEGIGRVNPGKSG